MGVFSVLWPNVQLAARMNLEESTYTVLAYHVLPNILDMLKVILICFFKYREDQLQNIFKWCKL